MNSLRSWLVRHLGDKALARALKAHAHGMLLDIGCGLKPHQRITRELPVRHVGVDHPGSQHGNSAIDIASTAYALPFRDETFDCTLHAAVLEHLEEPELAIRETFRVLKPGGRAIATVPFIWHVHEEPRDFYRYSRYGLEYLYRKAGFRGVSVQPLSGFWVTFGQLFSYQLWRLHRGPLRWVPVIPLAGLFIQWIALGLDRLDCFEESRKWTWAYLVVAEKGDAMEPADSPTETHKLT